MKAKPKPKKKPAPVKPFADHHFGVWTHGNGQTVAAYARYSHGHEGFVVYDATTGRSLMPGVAHATLESLAIRCAAFKLNPAGKIPVAYQDKAK